MAHFDAWTDAHRHYEETGFAYTPLSNSVLAWIALLPDTTLVASWAHQQDKPGGVVLNIYYNDTLIHLDDDQPCPAWVVVTVGATEGSYYCALFRTASGALAFHSSEIYAQEGEE